MLYLFTGLPRNGKSFYVLKRLIRELIENQKPIVTNMPLFVEKLERYLSKRGHDGAAMVARIRFISNAEVKRFWRCRGPVTLVPDPITGAMTYTADGGVVFIIDEAHIPFHSHKWDEISKEAPEYISQHGKLKDEVFLITQHIDKLAKQLKLDVQYYIEIAYKRREMFLIFQKGYHFLAKAWTGGVPEGVKTKPNQVWPFFPDRELFECYDSNAGHGVVGTGGSYGADKFRGLPPWVLWVFLGVVGWLAVWGLFNAPGWVMGKFFGKPAASGTAAAKTAAPAGGDASASVPRLREQIPAAVIPSPALWVTGIAVGRFRGEVRYSIALSDGRRLTPRDGLVKLIGPNFIDLEDGRRIWVDHGYRLPPEPKNGGSDPVPEEDPVVVSDYADERVGPRERETRSERSERAAPPPSLVRGVDNRNSVRSPIRP